MLMWPHEIMIGVMDLEHIHLRSIFEEDADESTLLIFF